jgi:hypothetical protein
MSDDQYERDYRDYRSGHFKRNWKKYALGAALATGGGLGYKYRGHFIKPTEDPPPEVKEKRSSRTPTPPETRKKPSPEAKKESPKKSPEVKKEPPKKSPEVKKEPPEKPPIFPDRDSEIMNI